MSASGRPTVLVLGSFLEREYGDLWQRQQEFVAALGRRANVVYLERAAAGKITPKRVLGRVRKMLRPPVSASGFVPPYLPLFVKWNQVPLSGQSAFRMSAERAWLAVRGAVDERGWADPVVVCVGTPSEVWAELLRMTGLPFWYDIWERYLESDQYRDVSREAMRMLAREALLVTADTQVSREDWRDVREDILLVPHGAKEWATEPDWSAARSALYYVGSVNPALDVATLNGLAHDGTWPVRVVGRDERGLLGSAEVLGWRGAGDIVRCMSDAVAGLVPYVRNAFTDGVYPTKVYDYLLAGAPVLGAPLPSLVDLPGFVPCESIAEYLEAAQDSAALGLHARRDLRAWALENSWSVRFEAVAEELTRRGISIEESRL